MTQQQDDLIRDRAYAIWQAEGCPEGRREQHWIQAAAEIARAREEAGSSGVDPVPVAEIPHPAKPAARRARKPAGATIATRKPRQPKDS